MSPNNVIVVAHLKDSIGKIKYYVFYNLNMDTEFDEVHVRKLITERPSNFVGDRGTALILAHNKQNEIDTEYGVREMLLIYISTTNH